MSRALGLLADHARPLLLAVSALLLVGVLLTGFNMLMLGWSVYALGHLGAILGFLAVAALYRQNMDGWAWAGLGVLLIGVLLALPAVASIWSDYAAPGASRDMLVPLDMTPLGAVAEIVTWIGLAFYGLAARGVRALPDGVGWVFLAGAVIGLLADFRIISPLAWVGAMLLVVVGLLAVGASATERAPAATESPAQA